MTCKEKFLKEHPEYDKDAVAFDKCPDEEGLIPIHRCKCDASCERLKHLTCIESPRDVCEACWNQRVSIPVWKMALIISGILALVFGVLYIGAKVFTVQTRTDELVDTPVETMRVLEVPNTDTPVEKAEELLILVETKIEETSAEPIVETEPVETEVKAPTVLPKGEPVTLVATAYCGENYPHICNNGDATKTATGTTPKAGRTIAVDPRMIPYGSKVIINGNTYIAEDCGGAINGNRIDIFFDTHQEALQWGRRTVEAIIITEND